jgi:hypothetical protein
MSAEDLEQKQRTESIFEPDKEKSENSTLDTDSELLNNNGISQYKKNIFSVFTAQFIVIVMILLVTFISTVAHEMRWPIPESGELANFNFVGVTSEKSTPSAGAIIIEVIIWSSLGVLARQVYYLSKLLTHVRNTRFYFFQLYIKLIGEVFMGTSISIAVVAFFISTSITFAKVELTLKNANILTIIAISFILGFYHEDTRRLLGSFHRRISGGNKNGEANENTDLKKT